MILDQLNYSVDSIKGIGGKTQQLLKRLNINSIGDLLEHFPRNFSDRTKLVTLKEAINLNSATIKIKVCDHRMLGRKYRQFLKILIFDGENYGALLCFNRVFLKNILQIGKEYFITGKFTFNYGEIQSSNFEYEEATDEYRGKIIPIYPLTNGLTQNILRKAISDALSKYRLEIEDELPKQFIIKNNLLSKRDAVKSIHFPDNFNDYIKAKHTFIYEEFFFQRLFMLKRKELVKKISKKRQSINFNLKNFLIKNLPFKLMDYQLNAIDEIEKDIFSEHVFSRLIQGDVGSGKTIVAFIAILDVVEAGYQAVFMAPTEILATQHYRTLKTFLKGLKIDIGLFTGNLNKASRDNILSGIKSGELKIIIGTHALFGDDVIFKNLGIAVIDEQQRFGVEQRYQLLSKGEAVDLLLMTATPIPRSLALSLYGDLELTMMKGSIQGRLPVKTWHIENNAERIQKMHEWIKKELYSSGRAIFVYPLIEESEKFDGKDLTSEFKKLSEIYGKSNVGLIHSKIDNDEKNKIMSDFKTGKIQVLAATTVVEVGIDVPDANIIVVENAGNYGLSTLHQLRGRVGRNNRQGYMILIEDNNNLTEEGKKRISIMTKENDGFKIAEEDLLLRGPGDFLGSRQSGLPEYKFADIRKDLEILKKASEDAVEFYNIDSNIEKHENYNTKISFMHRLKNYMNNYNRSEV